jgi:anti-anti-sigma factor
MTRPAVSLWTEGAPAEVSASVTDNDGMWLATISRRHEGGVTPAAVVTAEGDIDLDSAPLLRAGLLQTLHSWPRVICDLNKVTFFGAAGVTVLAEAQNYARTTGHVMTLRGARGMTRQILEMFGLTGTITDD